MAGTKRQRKAAANAGAKKAKKAQQQEEKQLHQQSDSKEQVVDQVEEPTPVSDQEEPATNATKAPVAPAAFSSYPTQRGYVNKQRVLVFSSRGVTTRYRHLMDDFRKLLPHHKKDVKLDAKDSLFVVNEIAEIKGCNTTLFFEARKRQDLYLWASRVSTGPSIKFLVQNVHTMDELKMTGNALHGSRPLLTFDTAFDDAPHLQIIKQMLIQIWGTPKGHPKSKPFIDRVMSFYFADQKIWCRNYQIADEADTKKLEQAALHKGQDLTQLIEIGPRFVLTPIRIFDGSFGGQTLYQNPHYVSPNEMRRDAKFDKRDRYVARKEAETSRSERKQVNVLPADQFADVFAGSSAQ